MNLGGIVMVIAGVWIIAQVLGGQLLDRIGAF